MASNLWTTWLPIRRSTKTLSTYFLLNACYLCSECLAVGNNSRACPHCASSAVLGLSRVIPVHQDRIRLVSGKRDHPDGGFYRPKSRGMMSAVGERDSLIVA